MKEFDLETYKNVINKKSKYTIKNIRILDNTLRDGEQTVGVAFANKEKIKIASLLSKMGIEDAEIGFPAVSEDERASIKAIVDLDYDMKLYGLCRLVTKDIDYAVDCGLKYLTIFLPGSKFYLHNVLRMDEDSIIYKIQQIVEYATNKKCHVKFSCENASRMPLEKLIRYYNAAKQSGASMISVPDTTGVMTPSSMQELIKILHNEVGLDISVHCHNDLGLATANTIAAAESGAKELQVCVNGLGERAGNASLEEVIMILLTQYDYGYNYDLNVMSELSETVYDFAKLSRPFNKPVFGYNVFSHESGIHVNSILSNERLYEPFPPEIIGREHKIFLGKHSGLNGLERQLDMLSIDLDRNKKKELLANIKRTCEQQKDVNLKELIIKYCANLSD
ncbi:MAG: homoaconitate hydratase [Pseudomonadota bacterium]